MRSGRGASSPLEIQIETPPPAEFTNGDQPGVRLRKGADARRWPSRRR